MIKEGNKSESTRGHMKREVGGACLGLITHSIEFCLKLEECGLQGDRKLAFNGDVKRLMGTLVVYGNINMFATCKQ